MPGFNTRLITLFITLFGLIELIGGPVTHVHAGNVATWSDNQMTNSSYYQLNNDNTKTSQQHIKQDPGYNPSDVHCIQTPDSLLASCGSLNWASSTRLPNLLDHRSALELNNELTSPMTQNLLLALADDVIECKFAKQLKLLVCSNLSPVCLDILVPPCKQLCTRTKSSCKPALQRLGLEWPKFLDCRRFPMSSNGNICIARQPQTLRTPITSNSSYVFEQTTTIAPKQLSSSTTISVSTISRRPSSKRRRKEKKDRHLATRRPTTETTDVIPTTSTPSISNNSPTQLTTQAAQDLNNNTVSQSNMTAEMNDTNATSEAPINLTTQPLSPSSNTPSMEIVTTTSESFTTTSKPVTTAEPDVDSTTTRAETVTSTSLFARNDTETPTDTTTSAAPMPTVLSQDLIQTLCQSNPDWLIKTKLTDMQLEVAVKRRKIKARSPRQIFGSLIVAGKGKSSINNQQPAQNSSASTSSGTGGKSPTAPSSVTLNLSNSTMLIFPAGPNLLVQSMNEPNPMGQPIQATPVSVNESVTSESQASNKSSSSTPLSRTYLVFGVNNPETTSAGTAGARVSHIIMWPGAKAANKDANSQASSNIVKTYRDFKLRGLDVCKSLAPRSVDQYAPPQLDGTTIAQANGTTATTSKPASVPVTRTRKQQQHQRRRAQDKL